jgi:hypothetical protein
MLRMAAAHASVATNLNDTSRKNCGISGGTSTPASSEKTTTEPSRVGPQTYTLLMMTLSGGWPDARAKQSSQNLVGQAASFTKTLLLIYYYFVYNNIRIGQRG